MSKEEREQAKRHMIAVVRHMKALSELLEKLLASMDEKQN